MERTDPMAATEEMAATAAMRLPCRFGLHSAPALTRFSKWEFPQWDARNFIY
jgi:hypothetical protein